MRRAAGSIGAAWIAGLMGCGDGSGPVLVDTLGTGPGQAALCAAGSTAMILPRGGSLVVTYTSATTPVACIDVSAGELIDLAVETTTGLLGTPTLAADGLLALSPTPSRVDIFVPDLRTIYAAVAVPASRRQLIYLVPSGCSRCASYSGTATLHFRSSGPIIAAQFQGSPQTFSQTLQFRRAQGESVLDTVLLRNVGAGSIDLSVTSRRGMTFPEGSTKTITGPSRSWNEGTVAVAVYLAASPPGYFNDTLDVSGIPDDIWNVVPFRSIPVRVRAHETDVVSIPASWGDGFTVSPSGDVIVHRGFPDTLYRVDRPSGALIPWRAHGVSINLTWLAYANGQVYFRGHPDNTLYRIGETGPAEAVLTGTSESYVILPDGSVYDLGWSRVRHRSATGVVDTLHASVGPSTSAAFSPTDSLVYYIRVQNSLAGSDPVEIRKVDAATKTTPVVALGSRLELAGTDSYGRLYAVTSEGFDISLGKEIVVMSASGAIVDRRIPPFRIERVRIARDSIFGYTGFFPGTTPQFWVMPVRPPAP